MRFIAGGLLSSWGCHVGHGNEPRDLVVGCCRYGSCFAVCLTGSRSDLGSPADVWAPISVDPGGSLSAGAAHEVYSVLPLAAADPYPIIRLDHEQG